MGTGLELTSAKQLNGMDKDSLEGSLGSRLGNKGEFARGRSFLMGTENAVNADEEKRRIHIKKLDIDYSVDNQLDDITEASSGTAGQKFGVKEKVGKITRHISRKKSEKFLFSGDEISDFDALQKLADLSLMMPATATEDGVCFFVEL